MTSIHADDTLTDNQKLELEDAVGSFEKSRRSFSRVISSNADRKVCMADVPEKFKYSLLNKSELFVGHSGTNMFVCFLSTIIGLMNQVGFNILAVDGCHCFRPRELGPNGHLYTVYAIAQFGDSHFF